MRRPLSDAEVLGAAVGALAAIGTGAVLAAFRAEVGQASAVLVLVLVVVAAASVGGRWAGAWTALAGALSFDFFLTRPYNSLAIKSLDDVVVTGLLLVVGLAVGHGTASRWQARAGREAGEDEIASLYRVGSSTSNGVDRCALIEEVEAEVAHVLRLADCRFQVEPADPPRPELRPTGRVDAAYVYSGEGFALPPDGVVIAVRSGGRRHGWLVCKPRLGVDGISRDRRRTALVLAAHLGLALDRAEAQAP